MQNPNGFSQTILSKSLKIRNNDSDYSKSIKFVEKIEEQMVISKFVWP